MFTGPKCLPLNPNLDHLRKIAKRRHADLLVRASGARLGDAQDLVVRECSFPGWRALKAAVEQARRVTPRAWHSSSCREDKAYGQLFPGVPGLQNGFAFLFGASLIVIMTLMSSARAEGIGSEGAALSKYVGFYSFENSRVFCVTEEAGHLYSRLGSQPNLELLPQGGGKFAPKEVPAEIEFLVDTGGVVTAVTIHQNGYDITMPRVTEAQAAAIAAKPVGHPMPVKWPQKNVMPRFFTPSGKTFDAWPCFSPDGKAIVFSRSEDRGRTWKFRKIAIGTGEVFPFADLPVSPTRCSWSKQDKIAFTGIAGGVSSLWIMNGNGADAHSVPTPGIAQPVYPSWYPDGLSLAVMVAETLAVKQIFLDKTADAALTDRAQVLTGMPSVSPDGRAVAFAGQPNKGQRYDQEENSVWIVSGGSAHTLEVQSLQGRAPVWSPDGKNIAFESDRGNDKGHYAIFTINRDGTGLTQLTDFNLDATHPVFSRDGRHIVLSYGGAISGIAMLDLP